MEVAVQKLAVISFFVIGLSHIFQPRVWAQFFVDLRGKGETGSERGWLLAAVGLLGKILGPIGLIRLILSGEWPLATAVLCLTNDLIWWLPFTLYLYDAWPFYKREMVQEAR